MIQFRKFSLARLLIAVSVFAICFGYVIAHREVGSDRLVKLIEKIGGQNHASNGKLYQTTIRNTPTAILFANRRVVLPSVHFGVGKIDAVSGRALAKNSAANGPVARVTFFQTQIDEDCPWFIWDSVTHVEFEDTETIPESWMEQIASSPNIRRVSFSGVETDVSFAQLCSLKNLNFLRLSNLGIYGERLEELEQHLPDATIKTSGLWGMAWPYEKDQTLSKHDPEAFQVMKKVLDDLKTELQALEPPATNRFNPPATPSEIAELEHIIGRPLPKYYRALLELHNGQKEKFDSLFDYGRLLSTQSIVQEYKLFDRAMVERSYEIADWPPSTMNFARKSWGDFMSWGIDIESGQISITSFKQKFHGIDENLPQFFRALTQNLKKGNYRRAKFGRVQIKRKEVSWYPYEK